MAMLNKECSHCGVAFEIELKLIKSYRKRGRTGGIYCSHDCSCKARTTTQIVKCAQCQKSFIRKLKEIKRSKSGNSFCSSSCAATYNNTHKKTGTRCSKLERFLEEQIVNEFPNLQLESNKTTLGLEFDLYFPSIKLAIEVNGIYHREPIYGDDKLKRVQYWDTEKKKLCQEKDIELFVYDDLSKRFIDKTKNEAWEKIKTIIEQTLAADEKI